MTDKFKQKYRIPSARFNKWDYGWNAAYFITICTKHKEHYFGKVVNGKMVLSEVGVIANNHWFEITDHFPFVDLGAFVVMPNHIHGIIIINKWGGNTSNSGIIETSTLPATVETPNLGVSKTPSNTTIQKTPKLGVSTATTAALNKWKSGNLGVIINQYKRKCTIDARKINNDFAWQTRYHDHIIRNDASYQRISEYIIDNVGCWGKDRFF